MKPQYLLPAIAAAIGFSVAWVVKPSAPASADVDSATTEKAAPRTPVRSPRMRDNSAQGRRPSEVNAGDFPLATLAEQGPKTRSEAKMLRLTEALDLDIGQQGAIIGIVEETRAAATDTVPVLEDMLTRGQAVEQALAKLLSPEQLKRFEELRVRERENRVEARAQKVLTEVISEIDLSPGQRDEVLARLRLYTKEQIQAIPAAATLLLNTSVLPTGPKDLSVEGVLLLHQLSQETTFIEDPMEAHRLVIQRQRQQLEERLECFDGILTSGQMSQYHAALAESNAIRDQLANRAPPPPYESEDDLADPAEDLIDAPPGAMGKEEEEYED